MHYKFIIFLIIAGLISGCSGLDNIFWNNKQASKEYFSESRLDLAFPPNFRDIPPINTGKIKSNIGQSLIDDLDRADNKK